MGQVHIAAVLHVLHVLTVIAVGLVVEAGVVGRDFNPGIAGHVEVAHEGGLVLRHLDAQPEAAGLGLVLHVPDLGAGFHEHLDAVAGVAGGAGGVDLVHAVEVALHLEVVLVAAAGQEHALGALDGVFVALGVGGDHAADLTGHGVLHQGDGGILVAHLDAAHLGGLGEAAPHAAVFKGAGVLLAQVSAGALEHAAGEGVELDHQAAPLQFAAAHITGLIAGAVGHALDPGQLLGKAVHQPVQVLVGNGVGLVAGFQVLLEFGHAVFGRHDKGLAGSDGVAARKGFGHLLQHDHLGLRVDVVGFHGRGRAGQAEANDYEVSFLIPGFHGLNGAHPLSRRSGGHAHQERYRQQQCQQFFHDEIPPDVMYYDARNFARCHSPVILHGILTQPSQPWAKKNAFRQTCLFPLHRVH